MDSKTVTDADSQFHMHRAIKNQPSAVARSVNQADAEQGAARIAASSRVFLIGIGTSFHAARVGEFLLRGAGFDARAVHSFDFALYGPDLSDSDCVIGVSHRGTKRYTGQAMDRARQAGAATVLVSGEDGAKDDAADVVLRTIGQEPSSAHTVSYTTAIAVLASLATAAAPGRNVDPPVSQRFLENELPAAMGAGLETEQQVRNFADEHAGHRRIWLAGGGPSAVTAEEIALKIKETSYLQAEGMSAEALLHGPFCCVEPSDLFVLIAPSGPSRTRMAEMAELITALGAALVIVEDDAVEPIGPASAGRIVVPAVTESLAALTCVVPLQLFTFHLARTRGTNPDTFRADDPEFPKVQQIVQL